MSNSQLGFVMGAFGLFVVVALLLRIPPIQRASARRLRQLGEWTASRVEQVPETDPEASEVFLAFRRERLRADLARLQRLLVTDTAMSATRQLGNRLAYEWVKRDLQALPGPTLPGPTSLVIDSAPDPWVSTTVGAAESRSGQDWRRAPTVEVLEIGWKR